MFIKKNLSTLYYGVFLTISDSVYHREGTALGQFQVDIRKAYQIQDQIVRSNISSEGGARQVCGW